MRSIIYFSLAFVLLAVACRKEEFQQPPHGEAVPYIDTATHTITGLLGVSNYKLFNAAWQKSNVDTALTNKGKGIRFTVLAPDDAAMTAAGYTSAAIEAASLQELDSLVRYHVIPEYIDTAVVRSQVGNVRHNTILRSGSLAEPLNSTGSNVTAAVPYVYKQYMAMSNGSLLINGKSTGPVSSMYATNGVILHVNQVLQRPTETINELIHRDPRLSIFAALCDKTDSIWTEVGMGYITRYYSLDYFGLQVDFVNNNSIRADAFFAPSNEAFKNAGFNTIDDVMALNERSMPYFDWDYYQVVNGFVTDSLLDYHAFGRLYAPADPYGGTKGATSRAVFYSNDLDNAIIGDFDISTRYYNDVPAYKMPLEFGINAAGQRTVKVKGSSKPAAAIIEADINTFQGPVHVVNNLILSDKVAL